MAAGRPEKYPVKKVIGFDQEMLDAIDEWRRQQTPIPTVSDAIRELVWQGLKEGKG
jgi:regulatory protein YycI of two-component signal transduction system YycFG